MKGLGPKIKILRETRKLTLVEIAKKTGIDQATLSRIENGKMTGTLDSHMRIAEALGVRLPDLYNQVLGKVEEAKEKAVKEKLSTFSHSPGAISELLVTGILHKKMMPLLIRLKPGASTATEEYPPLHERFLYIVKGELQIKIGPEKRALKTGESLYFDASEPHAMRSVGRAETFCLSIMTPVSL